MLFYVSLMHFVHISDSAQAFDNTFALVQTVERNGKVALTTVPNYWTSIEHYPADQHSSKFGNDMVLWPTPKGPDDKTFWEKSISKPAKELDLSTFEKFRCKVRMCKIKSYAMVSFNYKLCGL